MTRYIYELNNKADSEMLLSNGFLNTTKSYLYKRRLYEKAITLNISVSKEEMFVNVEVYDEYLKQPYAPFYNQDINKSNEVLKAVLENFNKIIDSLIKKGILE